MATNALTRRNNLFPFFDDEFFKPWNTWFDSERETKLTVPAVNVSENENSYQINVAAPGIKKEDFHIDISGRMLTISAEAEQSKEENKDKNFTRREYNYASFSRAFSLPDDVNEEKIEAAYNNGILELTLPKKGEGKKIAAKTITVK